MDPAQLANEAINRFTVLHLARSNSARTETRDPQDLRDVREPGSDALLDVFDHLAKLDGWAKIAMDRLAADPGDARAGQELRRSLEVAARLHPQFSRRLADLLADRPAVGTAP